MFKLSLISNFYNSQECLTTQLDHWRKANPRLLAVMEFILVDDHSHQPYQVDPSGLNLRLFRIDTDIPWNQPGARNLGTFHVRTDWAIYTDIDQLLNMDVIAALVDKLPELDPLTMYYWKMTGLKWRGQDWPFHPNCFLVYVPEFKLRGCYDEDFAGHYGHDDSFMEKVWQANGGKQALFHHEGVAQQLPFTTEEFSRDASHNLRLMAEKVAAGTKNSPGMLRFRWHEVDLRSKS
jgi:hypothetical protein